MTFLGNNDWSGKKIISFTINGGLTGHVSEGMIKSMKLNLAHKIVWYGILQKIK